MNGQLCGREWPITSDDRTVKTIIFLPDQDALERVHANRYVAQALTELEIAHLTPPSVTIRGQEIEGMLPCTCPSTRTYILFTNYLSLESPLRCGNCFRNWKVGLEKTRFSVALTGRAPWRSPSARSPGFKSTRLPVRV